MVHWVLDLCKEPFDLLLREFFRQRSAEPQEMAWLDWIGGQLPPFGDQIVKEMLDRIEPPIDRGRRQFSARLLLDEVINIAP
jgi:hypothetical protein